MSTTQAIKALIKCKRSKHHPPTSYRVFFEMNAQSERIHKLVGSTRNVTKSNERPISQMTIQERKHRSKYGDKTYKLKLINETGQSFDSRPM